MFIKKLHLQSFKRFSDLTIDLSSQSISPKLVLLIWANGSGKSSIMDVFQTMSDYTTKWRVPNAEFIWKNWEYTINISTDQWEIISSYQKQQRQELAKKFYTRPSIRIVPEIWQWSNKDDDSVRRSIDFERRFDNDVFRYIDTMASKLWQIYSGNSEIQKEVHKTYIQPFNDSLKRIFGLDDDLLLQFTGSFSIAWPGTPPNLQFKKWISQDISFSHLSHGEKQVVIILLNFIMRKEELADKVIFIDEMDVHLHTTLQYNLIKEITEYRLPQDSQLWTASHALWFIDYAKNNPDAVIIDFDNLNFDEEQKLKPLQSEMVYDIAVPQSMLSVLFAGINIRFCENKNSTLYNYLWLENTVFVPANDKAWVIVQSIGNNLKGIIDRDYLTDNERHDLEQSMPIKVLEYYCLENHLYHPDNLEEYYNIQGKSFDKAWYIAWLINAKNLTKDEIKISKIKNSRDGYYFFKQQHQNNITRESDTNVWNLLDSDDIESFLKVFTLKDYAKDLPERKNINPNDLMKTERIKINIGSILN